MRTFAAFTAVIVLLLGLAAVFSAEVQESDSHSDSPATTIEIPPRAELPETPQEPVSEPPPKPAGALSVSSALSHGKLPTASFDELYAEVRILATDKKPEQRSPLNVALVIDRSGSMHGEPMEKAKDAARIFVDGLSDHDRVTLVAFDHRSQVLVEAQTVDADGRARLHGEIDRIRAGGTTNISGGLRDGKQAVERHAEPEMVNRVILFTDGIPNVGITDPDGLAAKSRSIRQGGVTVSTLGFGPSYDARLMRNMAEEGSGSFRHVTDANDLEMAFGDELETLRNAVASGVQLDLLAAEGVEIDRIYGFRTEEIARGKRISIGELEAGGRRSVVVRLRIDQSVSGSVRDLLEVQTQYVDRLRQSPARISLAIDAEVSTSDDEVEPSMDSDVMARVEEVRTQDAIDEVLDMYRRGEQQRAQRRLEQEQQRVRTARRKLRIDERSESAQRVDGALGAMGTTVQSSPTSAGGRNRAADMEESAVDLLQGK